ncbi:hypothetical protein C922_03264 [Plasmodium inui San Antonio 1]|uniref:Uncharacterized protein n=1 Tax=Plasmodium inui San Antonio 1 TaxID=1237626 RepID=W7A4W4_9APIC|nr:hypothetical protein C922_03264 [Plasmodium inui San Antonio 1]EUD66348.1 hypothetical protein C922_03264 [Plasmodium inui San Antonio 1]
MKGSLLIVSVALLTSSFCFLVKEKSGLLGFTRGNCIWGREVKGRGVGRKFVTRWREDYVCDNGGTLQQGAIHTDNSSNDLMQGDSLGQVLSREEKTPHPKRRKFLNAQKEDDYYHLYLYHIYKKVKLIKKQKYLYNPSKYESVRSYIKRELKECLDVNTAAYLFKATEYYAKGVLEVSVYVSEVVNLLSFFTFNDKCNEEADQGDDQQAKEGADEQGKGGSDEQAVVDNDAEQILKGSGNSGNTGKRKITKLLQKDEKYKSFCLYFTRLVDSVSGLFCCMGKRSKREEILTYLKKSNLTEKWQNYSLSDLNLDTHFMIYVIRLIRYKDANYLCSLRRLKEYTAEQVKEIFLNCMRDGLLDLDYLTILQSEYLARKNSSGEMASRIFAPSSEGDGVRGRETQIRYEHLRKLEQNYEALLKKYTDKQKEKKSGKLGDDQLKGIINEILDKDVFIHKEDSDKQAKKKKKKKKKKKNVLQIGESLIRMDMHEVEEERLQEVIKKWCGPGTMNLKNCSNLVKRMNRLLDSHDVNVVIRLRPCRENGLTHEGTQKDGANRSHTSEEIPQMSDTTEDGITVRDIRSSTDVRSSRGSEAEYVDKKVDLSDFSLSNLKKYITYRKALERKKMNQGNIAKREDSGEKSSQANPQGLSKIDQDVLKYFDVTQKQDSVLFEINDFILEKEISSAHFRQEGQPVVDALPGEVGREVHEGVGDVEETDPEAGEEVEEDFREELGEELGDDGAQLGDDLGDDSGEDLFGGDNFGGDNFEGDNFGGDNFEGDNFGGELTEDETPPRGKKTKINKKNNGAAEKLRIQLHTRGSTKSKHKFENLFPKNFEEKMELLMVILKEEDKNKRRVIVCADEEERNMIRMKCAVEGLEYEQIVSAVKNIKRYLEKGGNFRSVCFVLMDELASTLELRKVCGGLSERGDRISGERSGERSDERSGGEVGRGHVHGDHGSPTDRDSQGSAQSDVTIYHFAEQAPKAVALKKLFHSIVNEEDNMMLYMMSKKRGRDRSRETTREGKKSNLTGKTNHSDVFVPYRKRVRKKKLSKSEEKWLAFRRRTLKKIDEMKQKAHLMKIRKMKKRDQKVQRVVTKLKSQSKLKSKLTSKSKASKVGAEKK